MKQIDWVSELSDFLSIVASSLMIIGVCLTIGLELLPIKVVLLCYLIGILLLTEKVEPPSKLD